MSKLGSKITFGEARKIVEKYFDAMNNSKLNDVVSLYAENASVEDPVGSGIVTGIDNIKDFYAKVLENKVEIISDGDIRYVDGEIVFPFIVKTTLSDSIIKTVVIDQFLLDNNGKIRQMRAWWGEDNFEQISITPNPTS